MLSSAHKREGKRAFCCDHYRKDTFSEFSEARKGKISTSIPQFLLLDWKESSINTSLRVSCVQLLSHGYSSTTKKPEADGREWVVDFPGVTRESTGYQSYKCTGTRLHSCFPPLAAQTYETQTPWGGFSRWEECGGTTTL